MYRLAILIGVFWLASAINATANSTSIFLNGPEDVEFTIYPNPFRENITLYIQTGNSVLKTLRITNLIGKDILDIDLAGKSGSFSQKIDFDTLEPGIYFFTLYTSKGAVETKKVVKLK